LLLTDEYKCNNAWRQQLQSPLIQNVDMGEFFPYPTKTVRENVNKLDHLLMKRKEKTLLPD